MSDTPEQSATPMTNTETELRGGSLLVRADFARTLERELTVALSRVEAAEARAGRLAAALSMLHQSLIDSDEEGLIEHAVPMIEAKAVLHDSDSGNWLRDRLREERERLIAAAEDERVDAVATGTTEDEAYNAAITHVIAAFRALP